MKLLKQWTSVIVLLFILKGSAFAGGIIFYTTNGASYINAVQYETYSAPSTHLSYITVKGGKKIQIQSSGIIANVPFPTTGSEYSLEDIQLNIDQANSMALQQPKYAEVMKKVSQLWSAQIPAAEALQKRRLAEETAAKTAAEALLKRRLAEEAAAKKYAEENKQLVQLDGKQSAPAAKEPSPEQQKSTIEVNLAAPGSAFPTANTINEDSNSSNIGDTVKVANGLPDARTGTTTPEGATFSNQIKENAQTRVSSETSIQGTAPKSNNPNGSDWTARTGQQPGGGNEFRPDNAPIVPWNIANRAPEMPDWAGPEGFAIQEKRLAQIEADKKKFNLGLMYLQGDGVPKDPIEAAKLFRCAAENGMAIAQFNLGVLYDTGEGVAKDSIEAIKWYRAAAEQGLALAQFNLGSMYRSGEGIPQNPAEAGKWIRKAADNGDVPAQRRIGLMYSIGECGVPKDLFEAAKWLYQAAEQGDADSQFLLGGMYDSGEGVKQDPTEALKWFLLAAEQGHAIAQSVSGVFFAHGYGTQKNMSEAVKWYSKAAGQNDASSQYNLSLCYFYGDGVSKNDVTAYELCLKSAELGFAEAKYTLGWMLESGIGVKENHKESEVWYQRFAEQVGIAELEFRVGRMYFNGDGKEYSMPKALIWLKKAAAHGNPIASKYLNMIEKYSVIRSK